MSLETWKAEFYPVPADKVKKRDAVAHSLRKWIGMREENLKKHGCYAHYSSVRSDDGSFVVSGSSCSLCVLYFHSGKEKPCRECPLAKSRGGVPCDEDDSPWSQWSSFSKGGNPEPMIAALEKTLAEEKAIRKHREKEASHV